MKRRVALLGLIALICCMTFALATPVAFADMGPHPAVTIDFGHLGGKKMYATLLSERESTGPNHAYLPDDEMFDCKMAEWVTSDGRSHHYDSGYPQMYDEFTAKEDAVWQKFYDYSQSDGYYFLQSWWEFESTSGTLYWSYYAPHDFKLLLYFPQEDVFVCSDAIRCYAVHGYYTADLSDVIAQLDDGAVGALDVKLQLQNSYDYFSEALGLTFRIVVTILVELLVALIFRLNTYRQITTVIYANLATQTLLNVIVNLASYFGASLLFVFLFIPLEVAIFAAEATVYAVVFRRERTPVWKSIVYALVANLVSVLLGVGLSALFPFLF